VICVGPVQALATLDSGHYARPRLAVKPHVSILPKQEEVDYCACGACTGLRNTPIPATLTSTASPATTGPTPAGVPVAITSPGVESHHARDPADQKCARINHQRSITGLPDHAIDARLDKHIGWIQARFRYAAQPGAERIEAFTAGKLHITFLDVAGR